MGDSKQTEHRNLEFLHFANDGGLLPVTNRACPRCKQELPLTAFGVSRRRKDGISCWCKSCSRANVNARRRTDAGAEIHRVRERDRHRANPELARRRAKIWRDANLERAKALNNRAHRVRMADPQLRKKEYARIAAWGKRNPARITAKARANHLSRRYAQPAWLSVIQKAQIQEFYEISAARTKQTGIKHHVDHMFAIHGAGFCGLHVPWNLQVLTGAENDEKWINVPLQFADQVWEAA